MSVNASLWPAAPGPTRRTVLRDSARLAGLLLASGALGAPALASVAGRPAFDARNLAELMKALGLAMPQESKEVQLGGPDVADRGDVVPVTFSTSAANARQLLLVVEKNPFVLAAQFQLSEAIEPSISTRVKMAQSSRVYAVVITPERVLYAQREIAVTLGGCG